MSIFYLNMYSNSRHVQNRTQTTASNSKIEYMLSSFPKDQTVINVSSALNRTSHYAPSKIISDGNIQYKYCPSLGTNIRFRGMFQKFYLLLYLMLKTCKNDTVVVYHSLFFKGPVSVAKKVKRFQLVIELNDFYQYSYSDIKMSKAAAKTEEKFWKCADMFVLANPDMKDRIGTARKAIVNYGSYVYNLDTPKRNNSAVELLYSGVAEQMRGAAFLAAEAMQYLSENYKLHLACYGTSENIQILTKKVQQINEKLHRKAIVFHGTLTLDELHNLSQQCHIALSCHGYSKGEEYKAKYSFPSKIPLNMGDHLYVVSPMLKTFYDTPFRECMTFFEEFTPQSIAKAVTEMGDKIINGKISKDPAEIICRLDKEFKKDMADLLEN